MLGPIAFFLFTSLLIYHGPHMKHVANASQSALKTSDIVLLTEQAKVTLQSSLGRDVETVKSLEPIAVPTPADIIHTATRSMDTSLEPITVTTPADIIHTATRGMDTVKSLEPITVTTPADIIHTATRGMETNLEPITVTTPADIIHTATRGMDTVKSLEPITVTTPADIIHTATRGMETNLEPITVTTPADIIHTATRGMETNLEPITMPTPVDIIHTATRGIETSLEPITVTTPAYIIHTATRGMDTVKSLEPIIVTTPADISHTATSALHSAEYRINSLRADDAFPEFSQHVLGLPATTDIQPSHVSNEYVIHTSYPNPDDSDIQPSPVSKAHVIQTSHPNSDNSDIQPSPVFNEYVIHTSSANPDDSDIQPSHVSNEYVIHTSYPNPDDSDIQPYPVSKAHVIHTSYLNPDDSDIQPSPVSNEYVIHTSYPNPDDSDIQPLPVFNEYVIQTSYPNPDDSDIQPSPVSKAHVIQTSSANPDDSDIQPSPVSNDYVIHTSYPNPDDSDIQPSPVSNEYVIQTSFPNPDDSDIPPYPVSNEYVIHTSYPNSDNSDIQPSPVFNEYVIHTSSANPDDSDIQPSPVSNEYVIHTSYPNPDDSDIQPYPVSKAHVIHTSSANSDNSGIRPQADPLDLPFLPPMGTDRRYRESQSQFVMEPADHSEPQSQSVIDHSESQSQSVIDHTESQSQSVIDHRKPQSQSVIDHRKPQSQSVIDHRKPQSQSVIYHRKPQSQSVIEPSEHAEKEHMYSDSSSVALSGSCSGKALCQTSSGLIIDMTVCDNLSRPIQINATYESTTVKAKSNLFGSKSCMWIIHVPEQHHILITFDPLYFPRRLMIDEFQILCHNQYGRLYETTLKQGQKTRITVSSRQRVYCIYNSMQTESVLIFHVILVANILSVERLPSTAGFVTPPDLAVDTQVYLGDFDYDGRLDISLPCNYSILVKFVRFRLWLDPNAQCTANFLTISVTDADTGKERVAWEGCREITVPVMTFRSSVRVHYFSDSMKRDAAFSMIYVTLPASQEPVLVTENTYNCSVPHFHLFRPLFSCNFVTECAENEDEEDCDFTTPADFATVRAMCDGSVLCEVKPGVYFVTSTLCNPSQWIEFNATTQLSIVLVAADPLSGMRSVSCQWWIHVPFQHHVVGTYFDDEGYMKIQSHDDRDYSSGAEAGYEWDLYNYTDAVHMPYLKNSSHGIKFTSLTTLSLSYSRQGAVSPTVTFQFVAVPNILPSGRLSDTAGFVTSPNFDFGEVYPAYYDGTFDIRVPVNSSVLVQVAYMSVHPHKDLVIIYQLDQNNTERLATEMSGINVAISLKTFRSSIRIRFKSSDGLGSSGFKLVYAIVPTHLEPVGQEGKMYDCSVPQFHLFMPLFRCNFRQECQGMEDETGCGYSHNACPAGAHAAGRKCYTLTQRGAHTTWQRANIECNKKQLSLISPSTAEEMDRLRRMVYKFGILDFFVGLQRSERSTLAAPLVALYRNVWQRPDGRAAFTANVSAPEDSQLTVMFPVCTLFKVRSSALEPVHCFEPQHTDIMCETDLPIENDPYSKPLETALAEHGATFSDLGMVSCPGGHVTRDFMSCDTESQCNAQSLTSCRAEANTFPMFTCDNQQQSVPYSLVCDHISQCADNSDESFCQFEPCGEGLFPCRNGQCTEESTECDGQLDCVDKSDEICQVSHSNMLSSTAPPAIVHVHANGTYTMDRSDACPATHFRCVDGYCLPVFLRCNGIADCVGLEDEVGCDSFTCPGYYRCRGSTVCLHPDHVCDGVFHCPQYDDELLCQPVACPDACQCQGLSFVCTAALPANVSFPQLRCLDVRGTPFSPQVISDNWYLIYTRLSQTGLTTVPTLRLPNLRQLDLSDNQITAVNMESFKSLTNLRVLVLRGNPLRNMINAPLPQPDVGHLLGLNLRLIDLSHTQLAIYNDSAFSLCPDLKLLNMSYSKLHTITKEGFRSTLKLEHLDVRASSLKEFPPDLLKNLSSLQTVYADNFVLCCEAMLPDRFDAEHCHTQESVLTSCEDLLRTNVYRAVLWTFASLAVLGNAGSVVGRLYLSKKDGSLNSFNIFVTNLSIADLLMGVYLGIIGVADQVYLGKYLWHSEGWRRSATCSLAGFLSLLSSEVSAFIICLITLDRLLVLRFPFSRHLHFQKRSALVACGVAWLAGLALALVPLLPATSHWDYYSQTGICVPLPFSSGDGFPGHSYSLGVMIVFNFLLFVLIAAGQLLIYWSVRKNTAASSKDPSSRQATVARRLTAIVVTDFLCWFPIGLLGLLAARGTSIPGEVNVVAAVMVLPFNSALNPFLYTFNTLMERRQKSLEDRLMQRLHRSYQTSHREISNTGPSVVTPVVTVSARDTKSTQTVGTQAVTASVIDTKST